MYLKRYFLELSPKWLRRYRIVRVLASFFVFLVLFGCLAGSIRVASAAAFTLTSTAQTETTVTLSWATSSDVWFYSYTGYKSTNVNGPWDEIFSTGDKGKTSYGVDLLSSDTYYYFYIHDSGLLVGYNSNTLQVKTASNPQLMVTDYDYSSATLAWTDYNTYSSLEPFVSYTLQMSSSDQNGPWSAVTSITDSSQKNYRQMGLFHQTYWFRLYDTVGTSGKTQQSFSNVANQTIPYPPLIVITPSVIAVDVNQQVQFSSSVTGGVPPYSNYKWYVNGDVRAGETSPSFSYYPSAEGIYYIKASVQDTLGIPFESDRITINVTTLPETNISASTLTPIVNEQDQFSSYTTGGATPYRYQWYSNGNPEAGATSSSYTFTPTVAGPYNIYLVVQDYHNGTAISNVISITAIPLPLNITISASSLAITTGQQDQFTASASGGVPPYSYQWYSNGNPVVGATSSSYTFAPTAEGTYNINATVQDNSNTIAHSNLVQVKVTSPPLPLLPIIAAIVVIIIVAIVVALVLRNRNRRKQQKTK